MNKYYMVGLIIEAVIFLIPVATLLVQYGKILANIESCMNDVLALKETAEEQGKIVTKNETDIETNSQAILEIKEIQKTYQTSVEKSLDEIKNTLASVNTALQVLTAKFSYIEKEKGFD